MCELVFLLVLGTLIPIALCGRADKANSLSCYVCHTLRDAELCNRQTDNISQWESVPKRNCSFGENFCQVRRFMFSANGTDVKVWMVERGCANTCSNECVITGDRSKLHLCTSCCKENLCNTLGNDSLSVKMSPVQSLLCLFIILFSYFH